MAFPNWPWLRTLAHARRSPQWPELKLLLRQRLLSSLKLRNRSLGINGKNNKSNPAPPAIFQMATGYWLSQAIYVAAKLGIADFLKDGPKSCTELAVATKVDEQSLFRLMRALSSAGIFVALSGGSFALSNVGRELRSDVPGSQRAIAITLGEIHYQAWGELLHSVQTGSPGFDKAFDAGLFEYLQSNAEAANNFHEGMTDVSSMVAYAVLMAYDFSGISSMVDVGGGEGAFLRKILELHPEIEGTVFDLEPALKKAHHLNGKMSKGKCTAVAGNFFESVPQGADAYIMSDVIHDWNDEQCVTILQNCRKAMSKKGRVLVVETVVPEGDAPCFSKLLDVNMLVMTRGKERTRSEFNAVFDAAGYKLTRVVRTVAPQSVIEGIPKT